MLYVFRNKLYHKGEHRVHHRRPVGLHDDVFAFLAYRKTDDKYTTLIGRIDYTDLASADGEGELGAVVDEGEFPAELVSYVELEFSSDYAIKRFCFDENNIYVLGFTMCDGKFVYSLWTFEMMEALKRM